MSGDRTEAAVQTDTSEAARDCIELSGKLRYGFSFDEWNIWRRGNVSWRVYYQPNGPVGYTFFDSSTDGFVPNDELDFNLKLIPITDDYETHEVGIQPIDDGKLLIRGKLPKHGIGYKINSGKHIYSRINSHLDGPVKSLMLDELYSNGIAYEMTITGVE